MNIKEIKYFRTDGQNVKPSGVYYAKGKLYESIRKNEKSFICGELNKNYLTEKLSDFQYGLSKYNGGIIVFAVSVNTVIDKLNLPRIKSILQKTYYTIMNTTFKNKKLNNLVKKWNSEFGDSKDMFIGNFSIGNFFKGRYIGDNGEVYNDKSSSIDLGGVPSELLLLFATKLCKEFKQEIVLVKDFNQNKLYLVNDENYVGTPQEQISQVNDDLKNIK